MKRSIRLHLSPRDYEAVSSPYLNEGRKQDSWALGDVVIHDDQLFATARMTSTYASPTDSGGFHLSVFTALEIASQLNLIYAHAWAGTEKKTSEGWMVECSSKIVAPVRNSARIDVAMKVAQMRKLGANMFSIADYSITDDTGGLFELRLKAISS